MSIFKILEEKKAKMDLNKIKKYLRSFNTEVHQKNKETITTNSFQALKLNHNSHNNQEELTLYGDVISKQELVYDGDFYSVLDIDKIKDIKNYIENVNPFNYPEEIHESTVEETLDDIHNKMKSLETENFNSSINGKELTLNNKIGKVRYEQHTKEIHETNSTQTQTKIFLNEEIILNQINETNKRKEKEAVFYIDSKKIIKANEEIDNRLNEVVSNKSVKKNAHRKKM